MPNNFLYINFFGGSYGNFVKKFLKLDLKEDTVDLNRTDFHYQLNYTFSPTLEIAKTHENENIKDTKKNLKICTICTPTLPIYMFGKKISKHVPLC